jgi:hypothetical protein
LLLLHKQHRAVRGIPPGVALIIALLTAMYLLTQCASCAAPLSLDAPKCVRCKTRYCNASCQRDHWRRHKKDCEVMGRKGLTHEMVYAHAGARWGMRT